MRVERINNINEVIEIPIPESYRDCWTLVRSDYARYRGDKAGILRILIYAIINYNFRFCFLLRMSKYQGLLFPYYRWRLGVFNKKMGMSFSRNVKIGYSLKVVHSIGIIVNATAVIGSNCTLHQLTTIGSDMDHAAIIGDNVYIGPNVCLVENVHVGSDVKIGAGAVVVNDIPSGVTAVGVPAKVR